MKNIFKSLLVILVGIVCTYIVWALGCFIFTGGWLGAISLKEGSIPYVVVTMMTLIGIFMYLYDKDDYWN